MYCIELSHGSFVKSDKETGNIFGGCESDRFASDRFCQIDKIYNCDRFASDRLCQSERCQID